MKKRFTALLCSISLLLMSACSGKGDDEKPKVDGVSFLTEESSKAPESSGAADPAASEATSGQEPSGEGGMALALDDDGTLSISRVEEKEEAMGADGTWTIFVYLCGSNLESDGGNATSDLSEMLGAMTGDDVKFVVETGGSTKWYNDAVSSDKLQRYVIQNGDMRLVDEAPLSPMSDGKTLEQFVKWGVENYPAGKMGLILWDHGGGSISGLCIDELYEQDTISLMEMNNALSAACSGMTDKFEYIGFDACLMSTVETANICANYARYMIASQETEPYFGWDYRALGSFTAAQPASTGEEVGRTVCDTYLDSCGNSRSREIATLSVCDLSKLDDLMVKLNDFSHNLYDATEDAKALTKYSRAARKSDNFGGNNIFDGYSNMVDLGGLVSAGREFADGVEPVLAALDEVVVYQVRGSSHANASGLSIFYPLGTYDGSNDLAIFADIAVSPYYLAFVTRTAYGSVNNGSFAGYDIDELLELWNMFWQYYGGSISDYWDEISQYLSEYWLQFGDETGSEESSHIAFAQEPYIDEDGYYGFTLTQDSLSYVQAVDAYVCLMRDSDIVELGCTGDVNADWSSGYICDNFNGYWFCLPDTQLIPVQIVSEGNDSTTYTTRILLNGDEVNLRFTHNLITDEITIDGIWDGIDENGLAARVSGDLQPGDRIVPCYLAAAYNSDVSETIYGVEYVYKSGDGIGYIQLPDADYDYSFIIIDVFGNYYYTDSTVFSIIDGEVYYND